MSRNLVLLLVVLSVAFEVWLLVDVFGDSETTDSIIALFLRVWPYLRWILLAVMMPAIVVRILAKGDLISIRRLDIRTFTNLTGDPELDGANAARLLYRFLAPEPGAGRGGKTVSHGFAETKRPAISISAGVATISLPAVWSYIRQALLGRDIRLYGMLNKHENKLTVRAWTEDGRELKSEALVETGTDPLVLAIMQLAEDVKRDLLDLYGEVAESYRSQLRFELACETLERAPYTSRRLRLQYAWNKLESHNYEEAIEGFAELAESRGSAFCSFFARIVSLAGFRKRCLSTEASVGLSRALSAMGAFPEARDTCYSILGRDVDGTVHMTVGDILSYEGAFEKAIRRYDQSEISLARSMTGFSIRRGTLYVDVVLERAYRKLPRVGMQRKLFIIGVLTDLAQVYGARGRLREMWLREKPENEVQASDLEAMEVDLLNAVRVLTFLSELFPEVSSFHLDRGVRYEDLEEYDEAIASYERCIDICQRELVDDPFSMTPRVDMAWAYTGMSACYSKAMDLVYRQRDPEMSVFEMLTGLVAGLSRELGIDAVTWLQSLKAVFYYPPETKELETAIDNLARDYIEYSIHSGGHETEDLDVESVIQDVTQLFTDCVDHITGQEHSYSDPVQVLSGLVEILRRQLPPDETEQVFNVAEMEILNSWVNARAEDLFVGLANEVELHLKAEGFYGLSCLYAIEDEYDIAAGYLSRVIGGDDYGIQLFGFRNRAMLDSDLFELRQYLLTLEPTFYVETEGYE